MSSAKSPESRHRVVGGGFGGVSAAKALSRLPGVEITLVDRTNHHLFQPLLCQVATGVLSPGQVAPALRSLFRRRRSVRVLLAELRGFPAPLGVASSTETGFKVTSAMTMYCVSTHLGQADGWWGGMGRELKTAYSTYLSQAPRLHEKA